MKFKKIILLLVAVMALTNSANAEEATLSNVQFGYSSNVTDSLYTTDSRNSGLYLDWDIMKTTSSGFGYGVGIDANSWRAEDATGIFASGYSMYTIGASAKVGYTFESKFNIPLKLKLGAGYGLLYRGSRHGAGEQYEACGEYTFFENIGLGIKYKHATADVRNISIDTDAAIVYFYFGTGE